MCFNHFPKDGLTTEQQQLLLNIENNSLMLIEEREDLVFNPAQLHNDFLTNVIIDNDELHWGAHGEAHYEGLLSDLRHQREIVSRQIKTIQNERSRELNHQADNKINAGIQVPQDINPPYQISDTEDDNGDAPTERPQNQIADIGYDELEDLINDIDDLIERIENGTFVVAESPLGYYCSTDKTIHLLINNITHYANDNSVTVDDVLAYVYIHEMFHAFFDKIAGISGKHYLREIEEPMAECGALLYFRENGFTGIYDVACQKIRSSQNGYASAYGFGLYLFNQSNFDKKTPTAILGEYALKAKRLDHDSTDIIRYVTSLRMGYSLSPMANEFERTYFALLVMQILNVSQKQTLSFEHLFEQTKAEIKRSLLEKWEPKGLTIDQSYRTQIESIIDKTVSDSIIIENMSPWQSAKSIYAGGADYTQIIGSNMLKFLPYQHQVKAWYSLSNGSPYKSMVITTGTGSGKTESFMAPLITDIADEQPGLKAIFLYPLNALMEDQKNKLSDLIERSGADLTFAVYNGTTPEGDRDPNVIANALPHEVVYREQIRGKRWDEANGNGWVAGGRVPDIILTNPTMLEYMLLRKADDPIIHASQGHLSWFVIDETHTYSGAGADELAMLIRRVLKAFGIASADDIHFATSSATVGDSDDKLMDFISGVTGQDRGLIDIIKGKRSIPSFSLANTNNPDDKSSLLSKLATKDHLYLDELIPYEFDTTSRLKELDRLCDGGLKVKVHFFAEALTNGLYANMEDAKHHRAFNLRTDIPLDNSTYQLDMRYMRVYRCTECGHLMLGVDYQQTGASYSYSRSLNPMGFVAIDDHTLAPPRNVIPCDIDANNQLQPLNNTRGQVLLSLDQSCPCCGEENTKLFNVTTASTLRAIMPTLLMEAKENGNSHPFGGRQLISFTDSRRGAAENSLEQNLETERHWVISSILNYLNNHQSIYNELRRRRDLAENNRDRQERNRINEELDILQDAIDANDINNIRQIVARNGITRQITWQRALKLLFSNCDKLAACFAKEKDWDTSGFLKPEFKRRYVLGALYNVTKSRSKHGFSPESYGIFKVDYANLENLNPINQIKAINNLNDELNKRGIAPLTDQHWKDFVKIYLDFHVRTNGGLFYKSAAGNDWETLDIDNCRNLKTEHDKRRSIIFPWQTEGVHKKLLWRLFNCDSLNQLTTLSPGLPDVIDGVCKALWDELKRVNLVEQGQTYYKAYGEQDPDWHDDAPDTDSRRSNYRLNLDKLSFCLLDEAYEDINVKAILDTTFMGHSPYQSEFCKFGNQPRLIGPWNPPYPCNSNDIKNFYDNNSVNYLMCRKIEDIYTARSIFIQYEHTAQVGRELTKARIEDFKDHDINILACSTTMEMGVDIGELEIVSMSNVPPHPANYKQRAGRAGRAFQNKSTCVTVCNSDAVGLAVMDNPRQNMLERGVMTPTANLNSPQVVQRHINSYLLREFLISPQNPIANRSIKNYWILDFFIDPAYDIPNRNARKKELKDAGNTTIYPNSYMPAFHSNSLYERFEVWLMNLSQNNIIVWSDLDKIKNNTALSNANNGSLISATLDALHELHHSVASELQVIWQKTRTPNVLAFNENNGLSPYERRLNYDFMSILCENMLEYCSTHQFTPNANMPVNIVSLRIHDGDRQYDYDNPSRDLVIALSEYAPGQSVTIDGKSFVVAGVDWDRSKAFRSVHQCRDCNYVWMGQGGSSCPSCGSTNVNSHNMIEPTSFLVENETSRMIDKDRSLAQVDAYLVGTNGLQFNGLTTLCEYDTEAPQATTQIIYANNGIGFGFCVCSRFGCGRSIAETQNIRPGDNRYLRDLMYHERKIQKNRNTTIDPNDPNTYTTVYEHQNLQRNQRDAFNTQHLNRNMLIGGSIQTNFSILKTYHWDNGIRTAFGTRQNDEAILTTLGLLVCEELAMEIPCQRQDIDFLIATLNQGHKSLCIYDTAKGGAGYSSKLDANMWKLMLGRCCHRLWDIITGHKSIDSMFSRMTMRYIEKINILETYKWLLEEFNSRTLVPAAITAIYPGATRASLLDIKNALAGVIDATLFVQPNINNWNYELQNATVPSWKDTRNSFRLYGNEKIELAFCGNPGIIPAEASDMIKHPEDWAKFGLTDIVNNGVYPLAYVNGWLYVTDEPETINFDGLWASGTIYAVQTDKPAVNQFTPIISSYYEFLIAPNTQLDSSKDLLDLLIQLDGSHQIEQFITNARGHKLEFCYMDEHLKNQLGAIMVIQLIDAFIIKSNCDIMNSEFIIVNEEYYDNHGCFYKDTYRRITDALQSHDECNEMIEDLWNNVQWHHSIVTKARKALPHWRSLVIKDLDNSTTLTLKPHGGIANGWHIDGNNAQNQGIYYSVRNTNINSNILLLSDGNNKILYTVSLKND